MNPIELFNKIRDIPYRIPLSLDEEDNCCIGKHKKLFRLLKNEGRNVRFRVCTFHWADCKFPEHIRKIPHDATCRHTYLEIEIDGGWKILDATWDSKLEKILPINYWDGKSDTKIATPVDEILSPEESAQVVKDEEDKDFLLADLERNGEFYKALNEWLEENRIP